MAHIKFIFIFFSRFQTEEGVKAEEIRWDDVIKEDI